MLSPAEGGKMDEMDEIVKQIDALGWGVTAYRYLMTLKGTNEAADQLVSAAPIMVRDGYADRLRTDRLIEHHAKLWREENV